MSRARIAAPITSLTIACLLIAGCSRKSDSTPPVATPTLAVSAPEVAIGAPVDMTFAFAVAPGAPPFADDYTVFVHFLDNGRELLWTDDHQPPTPTRQWKAGDTIRYTRTMFVPKLPYTGNASVEVGLYSPTSGTRLPLAGDDAGMRSYRVGALKIGNAGSNVFVVFKGGWHAPEVAEGASGIEWQWSRKEGVVSFRNPKRDSTVLLQVDQPVKAFDTPQHVTVRVGDATIDSFSLSTGQMELRRIAVTAAQLGDGETADLAIAVDKTFVPAAVPELKSSDARELGIRVFRVFVQPR